MKLFKGYIPTKNKKCLVGWKNHAGTLYDYEEIQLQTEFAGIIEHDVALIDVDDYFPMGGRLQKPTQGAWNRPLQTVKDRCFLWC